MSEQTLDAAAANGASTSSPSPPPPMLRPYPQARAAPLHHRPAGHGLPHPPPPRRATAPTQPPATLSPPPPPTTQTAPQSPIAPSLAFSPRPRVLSSAPARVRVSGAEADSDGKGEGDRTSGWRRGPTSWCSTGSTCSGSIRPPGWEPGSSPPSLIASRLLKQLTSRSDFVDFARTPVFQPRFK